MRRENNGHRAVCVHGAGGGGWEWSVWARVFAARGWTVFAPDLQPADGGLAVTSFHDYRAQVLGWCASTPVDLLVGASLGGLLALSVAAEIRPRLIVLVNPLPPGGLADARLEPYPAIVPWGSKRSISSTCHALLDADPAACLFAFRRWRDESGAVLTVASDGIDIDSPCCPVLILASEDDQDVPPETSRALAQELKADFELLSRASHVGPLLGRSAARTAQHVADWTERCFSEPNPR